MDETAASGPREFGRGFGGPGKNVKRRAFKQNEEPPWVPVTKLGRLVKSGKIFSIEDIFLHSIPIKEHQIVDYFFTGDGSRGKKVVWKEEVMKIMPVQKQTSAGQNTRFKAFVAVGDGNGHIGLGVKCTKEVATSIRGAITAAKLSIIPVRRGYWGNKLGNPHTVPFKVHGKCGSVRVRLIPAPRGTLIVGAPTTKKMLSFAGVTDCFSQSSGKTKTKGNFMKATFDALSKTYKYLTPDLWPKKPLLPPPAEEFSVELAEPPETADTESGYMTKM